MEYINRHMESRILELSKSYSAILLTGPRQAGKTTMLRELADRENIGRQYVTLDDLMERDMAKNDPPCFCSFTNRRCLSMKCSTPRNCSPM